VPGKPGRIVTATPKRRLADERVAVGLHVDRDGMEADCAPRLTGSTRPPREIAAAVNVVPRSTPSV